LISINALTLTIGAGNGGYRGLQGAMDDTRIYNSALSASEIYDLATLTSTLKIASNEPSSKEKFDAEEYPKREFQEKLLAYPNPFTTKTSVSFMLSQDGAYSLSIYNGIGIRVKDIQKGIATAGEINTIEIEGSWLPSGLYLLRLETVNGITKTIRVLRK